MGCFLSDGACDVTCSDHSDNKAECKALGCTYDDSKAATCEGDNTCDGKKSAICASTQYDIKDNCQWRVGSRSTKNKDSGDDDKDDNNDSKGEGDGDSGNSSDKGSNSRFSEFSVLVFILFTLVF